MISQLQGEQKISNHYSLFILVLIPVMLSSCIFHESVNASSQTNQASSKIQEANNALNQAFAAIVAAEKVGVNTTDLILQLSVAADILTQTENSFRSDNMTSVLSELVAINSIIQNVTVSAHDAEQTFAHSQTWSIPMFSLIGVLAFVLLMLLIWRFFSRRYIFEINNKKLEGGNSETE